MAENEGSANLSTACNFPVESEELWELVFANEWSSLFWLAWLFDVLKFYKEHSCTNTYVFSPHIWDLTVIGTI